MGGDQNPLVVGGHHTVDWHVLSEGRYRFRCLRGVGAVDLEVAVAHVEWGRLLGGDHQLYAQGLRSPNKVRGPIGVGWKDHYCFGHLGFRTAPTTILA